MNKYSANGTFGWENTYEQPRRQIGHKGKKDDRMSKTRENV